jgi:hypothetical protein
VSSRSHSLNTTPLTKCMSQRYIIKQHPTVSARARRVSHLTTYCDSSLVDDAGCSDTAAPRRHRQAAHACVAPTWPDTHAMHMHVSSYMRASYRGKPTNELPPWSASCCHHTTHTYTHTPWSTSSQQASLQTQIISTRPLALAARTSFNKRKTPLNGLSMSVNACLARIATILLREGVP